MHRLACKGRATREKLMDPVERPGSLDPRDERRAMNLKDVSDILGEVGVHIGHGHYRLKDDLWGKLKRTYPFDDYQDIARLQADIQRRSTQATPGTVPNIQPSQSQAVQNPASTSQSAQTQLAPDPVLVSLSSHPLPTPNPLPASPPAQLQHTPPTNAPQSVVSSPSKHLLQAEDRIVGVKRQKTADSGRHISIVAEQNPTVQQPRSQGPDLAVEGGQILSQMKESGETLTRAIQHVEELLVKRVQEVQGLNKIFNIQEERIQGQDTTIKGLQQQLETEKRLRLEAEHREQLLKSDLEDANEDLRFYREAQRRVDEAATQRRQTRERRDGLGAGQSH